jgi:hypothetical protein
VRLPAFTEGWRLTGFACRPAVGGYRRLPECSTRTLLKLTTASKSLIQRQAGIVA